MEVWIKLLKAVDNHPQGEVLRVEKSVAEAYISAGLAAYDTAGTDDAVKTGVIEELRTDIREAVQGEVREILKSLKRPGVNIGDHIEAGEAEADKTKSDDDYIRCIIKANCPERPQEMQDARHRLERAYKVEYRIEKSVGATSGSSAGWTVPVTIETEMQMVAAEESIITGAGGATELPMTTRQVTWPVVDQYQAPVNGQSAFFGGIQVYRKGENVQRTETGVALSDITLQAKDLTALVHLDRDTVFDTGGSITKYITSLVMGAVSWRRDWEFFNGNGVNQSLGIFRSKALLTQLRGTANQINWVDVRKMYRKLISSGKKNACWGVHPYSTEQLLGLKDDSGRLIYQPWYSDQLGPAGTKPAGRLLGLAVIESEKIPTLGLDNDLVLMHLPSYCVGNLGGTEVNLSEQFRWDMDQISLRVKVRDDGTPKLRKPITLADGTNQVSAFVGLSATVGV